MQFGLDRAGCQKHSLRAASGTTGRHWSGPRGLRGRQCRCQRPFSRACACGVTLGALHRSKPRRRGHRDDDDIPPLRLVTVAGSQEVVVSRKGGRCSATRLGQGQSRRQLREVDRRWVVDAGDCGGALDVGHRWTGVKRDWDVQRIDLAVGHGRSWRSRCPPHQAVPRSGLSQLRNQTRSGPLPTSSRRSRTPV